MQFEIFNERAEQAAAAAGTNDKNFCLGLDSARTATKWRNSQREGGRERGSNPNMIGMRSVPAPFPDSVSAADQISL